METRAAKADKGTRLIQSKNAESGAAAAANIMVPRLRVLLRVVVDQTPIFPGAVQIAAQPLKASPARKFGRAVAGVAVTPDLLQNIPHTRLIRVRAAPKAEKELNKRRPSVLEFRNANISSSASRITSMLPKVI